MPCYDERNDARFWAAELQSDIEKLSAMLCMVLRTLEDENELSHFLELFDYKEAGIPRKDLIAWWASHKEEDRRRRERERVDQERQAKKKAALEKLTSEERKLLGVKG